MEVLYHIRPYLVGTFPYIGLKNKQSLYMVGTSNQSVPESWPLKTIIFHRYSIDIPQIFHRYPIHVPQIFHRYPIDIPCQWRFLAGKLFHRTPRSHGVSLSPLPEPPSTRRRCRAQPPAATRHAPVEWHRGAANAAWATQLGSIAYPLVI